MSAKIAVLGLVIEEPGPAYRLTAKLRQRLAGAQFADSNVYSALTRLEREGLICSVNPRAHTAKLARAQVGTAAAEALGGVSDAPQFEATPAGIRFFEEWLLESSAAPPLRDELHIKIALCQPHNLQRMIELLYGQELVCLNRVQELKRNFEQTQAPEPHRWQGLVMVLMRDAELSFWESRLEWLQRVRASLERMGEDFQSATRERRMV